MELHVQPLGRKLSFEIGANLLEVLRANEVPISYSCMSGRCGTCRCEIRAGEVLDAGPAAGRCSSRGPGGQSGVLACQAVLTSDCVIEIPEPDEVVVHPARIVKATVTAIEAPTHDIRRLRLRLSKPLDFSPGQYASLQFTPDHIRPYSMAGLAHDDEQEFQVRLVPGGRVSSHIFDTLAVGDAIRVTGPLGTAYLRRKHEGPMLCVGGGTGLAPVLSIVRGALEAGMRNPIHLYFGARSPCDVYDADRLQALVQAHPNLTVHIVVASGNDDPALRSGLVTDAIAADHPSLAGWRAYLCGAPAMVEAVGLLARRLGIAPNHVHADAFYPAAW